MEIKSSTFIVTGGASGLGGATVEMIVAAGGNAIIADVSRTQGEALAAKLGRRAPQDRGSETARVVTRNGPLQRGAGKSRGRKGLFLQPRQSK